MSALSASISASGIGSGRWPPPTIPTTPGTLCTESRSGQQNRAKQYPENSGASTSFFRSFHWLSRKTVGSRCSTPIATSRSRTSFSCRERVRMAYQRRITPSSGTASPFHLQRAQSWAAYRSVGGRPRLTRDNPGGSVSILQRRDLLARDSGPNEPCLDLLRFLQIGDQYGIKLPVGQGLNRPQRVGEKQPLVPIHESDQGQVHLPKADVSQLGQLPRPINDDPLGACASQLLQHDLQALPYVTVIRQGVLHVEIRETRFLGHSTWGQEIFDAVPGDRCDLDVALAGQALEVQVGKAERDIKLFRQ